MEINPAKVIWVFGRSGSGKTVWTDKYLMKKWEPEEIAIIGPKACLIMKTFV